MAAQTSLPWRTGHVYRFICEYVHDNGFCPSYGEIAAAVGLRSPSTVLYQLRLLEQLGYIERERGKPRKIRILERGSSHQG